MKRRLSGRRRPCREPRRRSTTRKEVIEMPVKWTRPKKAEKRAEARRPDTSSEGKPKGKAKGKSANAKAVADKKEAK